MTVFTLALQPNSVTGCIMGDPGMTRPMTLTVSNNSAVLLTGGVVLTLTGLVCAHYLRRADSTPQPLPR